jgi:hypothetical protein
MRTLSAIALIGILGSIPMLGRTAAAGVDVHIAIPPPPTFVIEAPPRLVVVPDTPSVYYAPDLPYNYFRYGGRFYTYHSDAWFASSAYGGPWVHVDIGHVPRALRVVPSRYYRVKPKHFASYRDHRHRGRHREWRDDDRHGRDRRGHHRGRDRHDD